MIIKSLLAAIYVATLILQQSILHTVARFNQHVIFKMFNHAEKLKWFYSKHSYTYQLNSATTIYCICLSLSICPSTECSIKNANWIMLKTPSWLFSPLRIKSKFLPVACQSMHMMVAAFSPTCCKPCLPPLPFCHTVHFSASQMWQALSHLMAFAKNLLLFFE